MDINTLIIIVKLLLLCSLRSFYRRQNVAFEEVHFLADELTPLSFLQIPFLCILENISIIYTMCISFYICPPLLIRSTLI